MKTIIYTTTAVSTFWILMLFYLASFVNGYETYRAIRICFLWNLFTIVIPFTLGIILYYVKLHKVRKYEQLYEYNTKFENFEKYWENNELKRKIEEIEANFNFWIKIPLLGIPLLALMSAFLCTNILKVAYLGIAPFHAAAAGFLFYLYYCLVYLSYSHFTLDGEFSCLSN